MRCEQFSKSLMVARSNVPGTLKQAQTDAYEQHYTNLKFKIR